MRSKIETNRAVLKIARFFYMIKENISIYEAIMSESSSLKFHLELLRLIPKNYSISSLELREKLLALGIERDLRSIQRALNTLCEQFWKIDCNTNDKPYSYRWKPDAKGLDMPIFKRTAIVGFDVGKAIFNRYFANQYYAVDGRFF